MNTMRKNIATRIYAIILCVALLLSAIPFSVITALAATTDMGTLSGITDGGVLTDENGENAVITYSNASLEWSEADPSIERNVDGWWVGVKMTAPTDIDISAAKYQRCTSLAKDSWTEGMSFAEKKDSADGDAEQYITLWGMINEQYLNDAILNNKNINYVWRFSWDGNETYEQTITVNVVPQEIKLMKDDIQVYPSTEGNGTVSVLSEGLTVNNANTNYVEVIYNSDVTLKWTEKDTAVGRLNDGWWAGMQITAPSTLKVEADFNGVTYQRKDGEDWVTKNFWDVKDSKAEDTTHFLTMWGLINEAVLDMAKAKTGEKTANYIYRFDWNKDGVYEQIVVLKINPENITLINQDNVQVYPKLATVEALTGGSVDGSATGKVTVNVSDVALNWSPKDESIGRNYDAWWAGAKITAPEGSTETTLANAQYRNRVSNSTAESGWSEWTSDKMFLDYNDGKYYINVWVSADRQLVDKYINDNKGMKIQSQYEFDWDGDSSYDQVITISIDPKTVELKRVDRTDFVFADSATNKEVWVGDTSLTNKAESVKAPGAVSYEIDADNTTVTGAQVDANGKVTFNTTGKITVKATIAEDDVYNAKTISYSFNVVKKQPENFGFAIQQPSDIVYGKNNNTFENAIVVPDNDKYEIEYTITSQEKLEEGDSDVSKNPVATIDKDTGKITIKRSGKITVVAKITADDPKYKDGLATYDLTIQKADQIGFAFTANSPESFVYSTTAYDTVKVEGGQVDGAAIKYEITEGTDVAEVVNTNSIKTLKSGKFTLSVTKAGNDCYKPVTITRKMEVTLAEQTTFAFTYPNPNSITYNENGNKYENAAINGESTGEVIYKVVLGNDVADFENAKKTAELTIKKAGTIKVEATKAADDKYAAKTISYQITVERAEQAFTFADGAAVVKNYGIKEYINNVIPTVVASKADGIGHGEGVITYSIEANNIGATIDTNGKISFADSDAKIGIVKVTVTRAADEKYKACSNEFTLEIKYPTVPKESFTIEKSYNANGWLNDDIKIIPVEGYTISFYNELSTSDWAPDINYGVEGTTPPVFYLKAENGDISNAITIPDYKMDKSVPSGLSISYDLTIWETILEKVFGFNAEKVTVTLKAEDAVSGIDYIRYSLDNGATYPNNQKVQLVNGEYQFVIPAEFKNIIKFEAVDMAGNTAELSDGKTIVIDSTFPELTVGYEHSGLNRVSNDVIYANGDVKVNFTLKAANFDLSVAPVIKVNEEAQDISWNSEANIHKTSVTLTDTGDYIVTFSFTDRLGRSQTYSKEIHVDKVKPVISDFVFTPGEVKDTVSNRNYYDAAQTVKVVITEHNFDPTFVALEVSSDNTDVDADKYAADFTKWSAWAPGANDTWTAEIPFDKDANYTVKLEYTDLAGNSKTSDAYEFTVDTTAPIKPTIKLNKTALATVVETITFGFFNAPIEVTVTSSDITAGVKEIKYSYIGKEGEYNEAVVNVGATIATDNDTIKFTIPADTEFKGIVSATAYDWSHNASEEQNITFDNNNGQFNVIVIDNKAPERTVLITEADRVVDADTLNDVANYDYTKENTNSILYYNDKATLTFLIDEANFFSEDVHVFVNGNETNPNDWAIENNKWKGTITLEDEGDYVVTMTYTDKSGNVMTEYKSERIVIDKTNPVISVEYHNKNTINTIDGREYYDGTQTATIKVVEHNFRADDFKVKVFAKDINGNNVLEVDENGHVKTYAENGAKRTEWSDYTADWRRVDDTYQLNITYSADANYTFDAEYIDLAKRADESNVNKEFTVDTTAAHTLNVEYSTNIIDEILSTIFFYNPNATIKVSATDDVAGIEYFSIGVKTDGLAEATDLELPVGLKINADGSIKEGESGFIGKITSVKEDGKVTLSFDVPAQFRGEFIIEGVTDLSHNTSGKYDDDKIVVVDSVSPEVSIEFAGSVKDKIDTDVAGTKPTRQTKDITDANTRFIYDGDITATITVKEANFYDDVVITVYRDGAEVNDSVISDWSQVGETFEYVKTVKLSKDGDYQIKLDYEDKSDNAMEYTSDEYTGKTGNLTYTSNIHTIDTTVPVYTFDVQPDTNDPEYVQTINGREYYNANRKATITVTDRNFRPNEVVFTVEAKDVKDDPVTAYTYSKLTSWADWNSTDNLTWTAEVPFDVDANYTVDFTYTDIAGNKIETDYNKLFTVDKVAPGDLTIKYIEPTFIEKVIENVTFHFYKAPIKVEISATDDISGVYRFMYSYAKSADVSSVNAELIDDAITNAEITYSGNKATATFTIPKEALGNDNQFRGNVKFTAYDRSENNADTYDSTVVIVDNIAPNIKIDYVADDANTKVQYVDNANTIVNSFAEGTTAYFNGNVTAKISINEANFETFEGKTTDNGEIIHNVGILLTKTDDNGVITKYEYLPNGAIQMYPEATPVDINWSHSGDVHTFDIKYDIDSEYVLDIIYTDLSTNDANISGNDGNVGTRTYTSKTVTVDKTVPVVDVKYSNTNIVHTLKERDTDVMRDYYDAVQSATITVTEHNFRADDFAAAVTAKDIIGADITVEDFKSTLKNRDMWTSNGNTHTITINYSVDANYTFNYKYQDLAKNEAAAYEEDAFTVDTTPTKALVVTYEESIVDKILETITFGFYGGETTVTITAEDDVSGVFYFVYSYIKSEGVSGVNAELLNDKIEEANENLEHKGKLTTATFTIPKAALGNTNQFNGTVKFTAYDRSENNTEKVDTKRIVVDNIKPTATITYNAPVQNANNISYYAGNIDAKIVVNEANFYSEDVIVTVTRDGSNYPVSVKWVDDSVDVHTGTFTLTEDGDYIVDIKYKDRSENEMAQYTSNRLTLDTKAPTVNATNIKINSANKDEKYGFTITANDINLDSTTFKPVLTATVRNENGSYGTKTISLGDMKTVEAGKTYSFTVDNLTEDAYYSLVCTLKDMSGNEYSKIALSDGKEYDKVEFSINRNGSTFAASEATDKLVNQYYVYSVNEDVVISEVNVDPVETYVVKLNGEALTEGTDFTTSLSNKSGEWSKRTYVISKDLFKSEGEYSIVIESTDKAQTTAYSDVKNLNVSFVVDQTAPALTISGLEEGGRYQVDEQTVTVIPTDDGGRLYSIKVIVLDADGKPLTDDKGKDISVRFEMSGEEFLTYLSEHDGKVTFTVPEGLENQVQIICNDCAVNEDGKTNEYNNTFAKVTVSQSGWIIFYANKPLFYGSIAGVILLTAGIAFLIVFLKKRKKEGTK